MSIPKDAGDAMADAIHNFCNDCQAVMHHYEIVEESADVPWFDLLARMTPDKREQVIQSLVDSCELWDAYYHGEQGPPS